MSFVQSALGSVGDLLYGIVIWLLLFIDTFVYWLINLAYQSFLAISQIRIFSDDDLYDLSQRIYIVIGVFALFLVAYALLTAIINPDNNKSETSLGKVIPNIAKAIIGIAIVPGIFNIMYDVQHAALCSNVIPKLVLGSTYAEGFDITEGNTNSLGAQMSSLLFRSFFYVKNSDGDPYDLSQAMEIAEDIKENGCSGDDCLNLYQAYQDVENGGPFSIFRKFTDAVVDGRIGYFYILSTIAGGFCVYVLISLCLDMALRSVKLSYLQIIAPLPLLTIIIPGQKKIFTNWLKKTTSCFIEVFTRLFIVVFAAYIMRTLDDVFDTAFGSTGVYCGEVNGLVWFLVKAATIVGLFWFIKQSPKLISEVTGMDSKGFKLGIKDKVGEMAIFGNSLKSGMNKIEGALTGGLGGLTTGMMNRDKINPMAALKTGAAAGLYKGGNQFKKQREQIFTTRYGEGVKQGLFGGKSISQKIYDKNKDNSRNAAKEIANEYVNEYEKTPEFIRVFKGYNKEKAQRRIYNFQNSATYQEANEKATKFAHDNNIPFNSLRYHEVLDGYLKEIAKNTSNPNQKRQIDSYFRDQKAINLEYHETITVPGPNATAQEYAEYEQKLKDNRAYLEFTKETVEGYASGKFTRNMLDGTKDAIYDSNYESASKYKTTANKEVTNEDKILKALKELKEKK